MEFCIWVFTSAPSFTNDDKLPLIAPRPALSCPNSFIFWDIIAFVFLTLVLDICSADLAVAIDTASDTLEPTLSIESSTDGPLISSSSSSSSRSKSSSKSKSSPKKLFIIPLSTSSFLSLLYHLPDLISLNVFLKRSWTNSRFSEIILFSFISSAVDL